VAVWTTPRTWVTGELVTSSIMNTHVRDNLSYLYSTSGELSYVEFTAAVSTTATTEATATTVVTAGAVVMDGSTTIDIEFYAPYGTTAAAANSELIGALYDGSSSIGRLFRLSQGAATATSAPIYARRGHLTPTAASHTYSIRIYESGGQASVTAGAGGSGNFMPGFIRVKRTS
jgi:hypothetical protein